MNLRHIFLIIGAKGKETTLVCEVASLGFLNRPLKVCVACLYVCLYCVCAVHYAKAGVCLFVYK